MKRIRYGYLPLLTLCILCLVGFGLKKGKVEESGESGETVIPVCFPCREGDIMQMDAITEKVMDVFCLKGFALPVKIWEESMEGTEYTVSFFRTSPPYENLDNDFSGKLADYRLMVVDGAGNAVWKQDMIHYPVCFEEVHWMVDVSGDGYADIIFCTDYISQPLPNAELQFLIWDGEKGQYVLRNPVEGYVYGPLWNEGMSGFAFYEKGFNNWVHDKKMYVFDEGGWTLRAEITVDSENRDKPYFEDGFQEEIYYKELAYFRREIIYGDGGKSREIIRDDTWDGDKDYYDKEKHLQLYPGYEWEVLEMELDTGGTVLKYVKKEGTDTTEGGTGYSDTIQAAGREQQGNILGYTLWCTTGNMWYEKDPDYLVETSAIRHGVFISGHVCVSEVFLGGLIRETIENRGILEDSRKKYFTEWGLYGLGETDWGLLEEGWKADPFGYLRTYRVNTLFGSTGYDFSYTFFGGNGEGEKEYTQTVDVGVSVDGSGRINRMSVDVGEVTAGEYGMESFVNVGGLYSGGCQECVVKGGKAEAGRILLEYSAVGEKKQGGGGFLVTGDVSVSAETAGKIWMDILESRGNNLCQYGNLFSTEHIMGDSAAGKFGQIESGWKADGRYDCYYTDMAEETGEVLFRYYFYPDYGAMGVEEAKAVILDCGISVGSGKISWADIKIFSMTKEEFRLAGQGKQYELIVNGGRKVERQDGIRVPVPATEIIPVPLENFDVAEYMGKKCGIEECPAVIWECGSVPEAASYLGECILTDIRKGEIYHGETEKLLAESEGFYDGLYRLSDIAGEGWKATGDYDCYLVNINQLAGCLHFRYYFYPEETEGGTGLVAVLDAYVSEEGVEKVQVSSYLGKRSGFLWWDTVKL